MGVSVGVSQAFLRAKPAESQLKRELSNRPFAYKKFYFVGTRVLQVSDYVTGIKQFKSAAIDSRFSSVVETKVGDSVCYIKGAKTQ